MAGVDQFGGNNEVQPVLNAYYMGVNMNMTEFYAQTGVLLRIIM